MPKYLIAANYVGQGLKGILKEVVLGGDGDEKVAQAAGGSERHHYPRENDVCM